MEVVISKGEVTALVSKTSYAATPLNVHKGSSLQEVFSAYGYDYMSFDNNGLTLYEYPKKSLNGKNVF